jgi:mono/diheme cytochrome c family protein
MAAASRRRTWLSTAWAVVLVAAAHATVQAQERQHRADVRAGREFALHNCDACHVIGPNQDLRPLVSSYAPSFSDIANKPGTTANSLRAFLSHQHGYSNMPYPDLTATDRENVIAYILSLRGRH